MIIRTVSCDIFGSHVIVWAVSCDCMGGDM